MSETSARNWKLLGILTAFALTASTGAAAATTPHSASSSLGTALAPTSEKGIIKLDHAQSLILPPTRKQKFTYSAQQKYWSVVATTEAPSYDLALYADKENTVLLARSSEAVGTQFVVVDSNHAPVPRSYYPTILGDGSGPTYTIEIDTDNTVLADAPLEVPMSNLDIVTIQDTFLTSGTSYRFAVTADPDQNPSLYLMRSDRHDSRTWYQDRGQAVAYANRGGPGKPEVFDYVAPSSGWYGLVLVNVKGAGSGVYTITRTIL